MIATRVVLLVCAIFAISESASIVDNIDKCGVSDQVCLTKLFGSILDKVIESGIPEMDVPPIDPYAVKNLDILLLGLLKFTAVDGTIKGFKNCKFDTFIPDIANHLTTVEGICENFVIEGQYKLSKTPALNALIGDIDIHGDGKASLILEKFKLHVEFPYDIKKFADNELHFVLKTDETTYNYEMLGKMVLAGDGVFIGKQDISTVLVNVFNENWQSLEKIFGKTIIEEALKIFYKEVGKFFTNVPISALVSDDISAYAN